MGCGKMQIPGPCPLQFCFSPSEGGTARLGNHSFHSLHTLHSYGEIEAHRADMWAQGDTAECPDFLIPSPVLTTLLLSLEGASGQPLWRPALGGTSASSLPQSQSSVRGCQVCGPEKPTRGSASIWQVARPGCGGGTGPALSI